MSGSGSGTSQSGFAGQQSPEDSGSEFNVIQFLIQQALRLVSTATLVQVMGVTDPPGQTTAVGTVDVQPLVRMNDGVGNTTDHGTIYKLPYFRLQAGTDGIVLNPKKGDIGLAVFADRDISAVKKNKKLSNPGSFRIFDKSDGLYLGGFLNKDLVQYLAFTDDGIIIKDKNGNTFTLNADGIDILDCNGNEITMDSDGVEIVDTNDNDLVMDSDGIKVNGVLFDRSQNVTNAANVTTQSSVDLNGHVHSGVQSGSSDTGPPHG
jgi:hypothetical protein